MEDNANALKNLLVEQFRVRVMVESVPRLKKCLSELSEEEVWMRPNENSNAVGNLVLHLCGNARQWILTGLGGAPDHRIRQAEFDARGGFSKKDLTEKVDALMAEIEVLLLKLTVEDLLRVRPVQVYQETGVSILVHVIEHFSYHVGQMTFAVKGLKNKDLEYYGGEDLEVN